LLVCSTDYGPHPGCRGAIAASATGQVNESTLRLVELSHRVQVRVVSRGELSFAGWNPRRIGWSPDGRYIAMGEEDGYAMIDTATGSRHPLDINTENVDASARWWP